MSVVSAVVSPSEIVEQRGEFELKNGAKRLTDLVGVDINREPLKPGGVRLSKIINTLHPKKTIMSREVKTISIILSYKKAALYG